MLLVECLESAETVKLAIDPEPSYPTRSGVGSEFGGNWDKNMALGNRCLHREATVGQCTEGRHVTFSRSSPGRKALEGATRLASSVDEMDKAETQTSLGLSKSSVLLGMEQLLIEPTVG